MTFSLKHFQILIRGIVLTLEDPLARIVSFSVTLWSLENPRNNRLSRSSMEAKYRSMASTTCELVWLLTLLAIFQISHSNSVHLYCDNIVALHIIANPVFHECTKYIELDFHFIYDKIQSSIIKTFYVPPHQQLANVLIKALGHNDFHNLVIKMRVLIKALDFVSKMFPP